MKYEIEFKKMSNKIYTYYFDIYTLTGLPWDQIKGVIYLKKKLNINRNRNTFLDYLIN